MFRVFLVSVILLLAVFGVAFAYTVPENNSRARFFYVFGQQGNIYYGADDVDHEQVLYIDVPETSIGDVYIKVYDPSTGGKLDLKPNLDKDWDTITEFSVFGDKDMLLSSEEFGKEPDYDEEYYTFGPFKKEMGKKSGSFYQFKFVANGRNGEDENLFKVNISPEDAQVYSTKVSFRLLPNEGDKMYFYIEVPAGTTNVTIENFDLDPNGGVGIIIDPLDNKFYKISDSRSGEWAATPIVLTASDKPRRLEYVITKKVQRHANAAIRAKDASGNLLNIYFTKGPRVIMVRPAPVVVEKSPDLKCNRFTFDATNSYDPNKEKLSFLWDFGDGQTSDKPVVTHAYEKGGDYTVTLTVKDTSGLECDTSTSTQTVKVNTPPEANFSAPETACTGSMVTFDASSTADDTPETVKYMWNFGDGTKAEGKVVNKTFDKGGVYKVQLIANDNSGTACSTGTITKTINVNSAPVADAGEDVNMCVAPGRDFTVNFNGGKSRDKDGDSLSYEWSFGDGKTASGESVSHVYDRPGEYTVKLIVDDGRGSSCSSDTDSLKVKLNRKPIADAGGDISACLDSTVNFDGSRSEGDGLRYSWNFGDGETATGAKVRHSYSKSGKYRAVLTVDDGNNTACSSASSSVSVSVNAMPEVSLSNSEVVCLGSSVKFEADAKDPDGDPLSYYWDFGDGTAVEGGSSQSHVYKKGGVYDVKVTVDDGSNTPCSVASDNSKVKVNSRPVANAGPNLVCCSNKTSSFDGSGSSDPDGDRLTYSWDFGDGATAQGEKVTHSYSKGGVYKVVLTVDDNSNTPCSRDSSSFEATVNDNPVSVIKVR